MRKIISSILAFSSITALSTSCNPVGEKIEEFEITNSFINTSDSIQLKKGDQIEIWCTAAGSIHPVNPLITVAYQLSKDGQPVDFQKKEIHHFDKPQINSSYESGEVEADYRVAIVPITTDGSYKIDGKILETEKQGEDESRSFSGRDGESAVLKIRKH